MLPKRKRPQDEVLRRTVRGSGGPNGQPTISIGANKSTVIRVA